MRKLSLALIAIGAAASLWANIPANLRFTAALTPSRKVDTAHLDGNDGSAAIPLTWATIPTQTCTNGTSASINLRSGYLTEAGSPNATLSYPGCSLPTGITAATDGLSCAASCTTGSVACSAHAVRNAATADSNTFTIRCIPAPGSDSTAPSIPGNLTSAVGAGSITWSWDPSTDQHDGTNAGSGLKEYDLELNGNITTVADTGPGLTTASTQYVIGSPTGTNTTSQSGSQWTITGAGTGIDTSPDQLVMRGWSITGDFTASVKNTYITSVGSNFAQAGLIARESSAVDARYVAIHQWPVAQSMGVQSKLRSTVGAAKTVLATAAGNSGAMCLRMARTNSATASETWTLSYSADCTTYTQLSQTVLSLPATLIVGPFVTSLSAGNSNVSQFNELSIFSRAAISYTQSTSSTTAARVRARDLATPANVSAYNSPTVSATPLASAPKVKWHPGIYVVGGDVMGLNGAAGYTTAKLDSVSASGAVGWKQLVTWGSIETSKGVYDFSKLDTLLAACKARNLRMAIEVGFGWYTTESIATATSNGQFPAYLATDTYAPASGNALLKNSIEIITRGWVSGVMDRWIALWQAIGAHYDSDSSVEDVQSTEFTTNATGDADYSVSAYLTQLERFAATVPASFPHTMTTMVANSGLDNSSTQFQGLIAYMSSHRISLGDHDMRPDKWPPSLSSGRGTPGQRCAQGLDGCPDYRGVMAITSNDEAINLGGSHTPSGQNMSTLLSDMFGWTQTYLHLDHLYITYKDYTLAPNPPTDIYWNTIQDGNPDIYDFIHAGGHTVTTACPSQYTGGCNTN